MSTSSTSRQFTYRPEIDGLRAIAVISVVLCHARLGLPGGFVGVDVFFVISGFLITSLIWRDLEQNTFSFAQFWERRARRITPALTVVTLAVLAAASTKFIPQDFKDLGESAAAQALFAANHCYHRSIDYFHPDADTLPLLHTWSLAVEEQFYLFAPVALFLLHRAAGTRRQLIALIVVIIGIAAGLATSMYFLSRSPSATFYFLPTRAWELLIGSALALLPANCKPRRYWLAEAACVLGMALIVAPCCAYTGQTQFPGLAALPPCLGAALIIWAHTGETAGIPSTGVSQILNFKPLVFVGVISYSLYLWHWPILAIYKYQTDALGGFVVRVGLVAFSVIMAVLSWLLVETPFRQRRICATRRSMLLHSAVTLLLLFGVGASIKLMNGMPGRLPSELAATNNSNSSFWKDVTIADIQTDHLIEIGAEQGPVRILIWGDSHAKASLAGFDTYLKGLDVAGRAVTYSATVPVLGNLFSTSPFGLQRESARHNQEVFEYIKNHQIRDVVLVANWDMYGPGATYPLYPDSIGLEQSLVATVERLNEIGCCPWLMIRVPIPDFDVPRALAQRYLIGKDLSLILKKPESYDGLTKDGGESLEKLRAAGCRILDPRPYFVEPAGQFYLVEQHGRPLFFDRGHLTREGSLMLVPMLANNFTL